MKKYPAQAYDNPVIFMLKTRGRFQTQLGIVDAKTAVGPGLHVFAGALPVADVPASVAKQLRLPDSLEQLRPEDWESALERLKLSDDDELIGRFYAAAAAAGLGLPGSAPLPGVKRSCPSSRPQRSPYRTTVTSSPCWTPPASHTSESIPTRNARC